jgi:hypothetical protein
MHLFCLIEIVKTIHLDLKKKENLFLLSSPPLLPFRPNRPLPLARGPAAPSPSRAAQPAFPPLPSRCGPRASLPAQCGPAAPPRSPRRALGAGGWKTAAASPTGPTRQTLPLPKPPLSLVPCSPPLPCPARRPRPPPVLAPAWSAPSPPPLSSPLPPPSSRSPALSPPSALAAMARRPSAAPPALGARPPWRARLARRGPDAPPPRALPTRLTQPWRPAVADRPRPARRGALPACSLGPGVLP